MPIRLRFAVHGVRNNRIFHLVAIDQRKRRNAQPLELLGVYRPRPEQTVSEQPVKRMEWALDRVRFWLDHGAVPSESVARMLQVAGIEKRTAEQLKEAKAEAKRLEEEKLRLAEERRRKRAEEAEAAKAASPEAAAAAEEAPAKRPLRRFQRTIDRDSGAFSNAFIAATVDPVRLRTQNLYLAEESEKREERRRVREQANEAQAALAADGADEWLAEEDGESLPEDELVDEEEEELEDGEEEPEALDDDGDDGSPANAQDDGKYASLEYSAEPPSSLDHGETAAPFIDERRANPKAAGNTGNSAPPLS